APPPGGAARASGPLLDRATVRRLVLPNGLTVLLRRDDTAPVVAIVTFVKAGYFDETDDVVGIAHVLEHMFFKGTDARPVGAISKETKAAGGYLNAGTIYDHTSYYTVLPSASFARGLEIQRDAYANSVIDAEELAKELEVIIQEAKRKADNPSAVATETLFELLHDEHRIRRWRIGREEGLRKLTRDDLVGFYRNFYRPSTTILSIVGAIDLDAAACEIEHTYGSLVDEPIARNPGPDEPAHRDFRYRELEGDITQTQLSFGWRTPGTRHPDTPLLELAGTMLGSGRGSRLYRAVRERKLATSVQAYDYTPTDVGVFMIHAEGPPETTIDAARNVWAQLADVRANGFSNDELNRARQLLEARFVRRLETMEGQANFLAEWEALGDWEMGERELERLLTATVKEVTDAVRRYLTEDSAGVIVYRPSGAAPIASDARAMRALLGGAGAMPLAPVPAPAPVAPALISRARFEREDGRVRVYRTATDVPILVLRRPGAPLVQLGIHVAGGATEEPALLAGLTSMLTRTSVKGTRTRSAAQIAEDGELLGGSVSGSTASESFSWGISVPARHTGAALELLSDVVQHATFEQQALDTERTLAIADLEMLRDDMYRYPLRLLTAEAFAGHPYGVPSSGTEESLGAINASEVREWHRARVLQGASVIGVVGDVDPDEIATLVSARFGELTWRERAPLDTPAWPLAPLMRAESRDKAQSALALAFPSPSRSDDARIAAELLAGVASGLGGRFFDQLRDKQSLAYTVSAFTAEWRNAGMFISYIATSPEKEEIARAGLLSEFAKLREAPVTEAELAQAKEYAVGTHAIRSQSGGALLGELIDAWLFGRGLAEIDEHDARIRRVTASEMQQLANRYFVESALVQSVIRGTGRRV
ncbi:MAG TPA: pitrilysin family protein, partial [Gemmatimonadaceae bacterium]|nr:pitrilysin family protein [Gemmatimonadaceae bacterium]